MSGSTGVATPTIDIHSHVMSTEAQELTRPMFTPDKDPFFHYASAATDAANKKLMAEITPKLTSAEVRLRDMDRMGVEIQAISVAPPQYFYWTEPDLGVRLARIQNDNLAAIVRAHPDRFVGLGTLPLQNVDASVAELERVVTEMGFPGIEICTSVNGRDFDHRGFEPLLQRAEELDVLVLMHPNGFSHGERLADYYLINTVGMPLDSTVAISRMIFGGVLERHADLKICVVHGGGYLPFYSARFDHAYRMREDCREHISRPPSTYLRQLHFDTMVFDPDDLRLLIERYGADHVLLGSDYPYDMGVDDPVGIVQAVEGMDEKERALVLGGNAARLLKLE
ncbi:MAG TPA: amidohydrolase family protein [Actinomycetota bacterium]|nr:amidohydrolase family protein [Actinomycetota bacterium]